MTILLYLKHVISFAYCLFVLVNFISKCDAFISLIKFFIPIDVLMFPPFQDLTCTSDQFRQEVFLCNI